MLRPLTTILRMQLSRNMQVPQHANAWKPASKGGDTRARDIFCEVRFHHATTYREEVWHMPEAALLHQVNREISACELINQQ